MRHLLLASSILVSLSGVAYAQGEGEPFPGPNATVTSPAGNGITARSQDPFHYTAPTVTYNYGAKPSFATRNQDPFQFYGPGLMVGRGAPSAVAQAPAGVSVPWTRGPSATPGQHG